MREDILALLLILEKDIKYFTTQYITCRLMILWLSYDINYRFLAYIYINKDIYQPKLPSVPKLVSYFVLNNKCWILPNAFFRFIDIFFFSPINVEGDIDFQISTNIVLLG